MLPVVSGAELLFPEHRLLVALFIVRFAIQLFTALKE